MKYFLVLTISLFNIFGQSSLVNKVGLSGGAELSVAAAGISAPTDISGCVLWLDGSDITQLYQDDALTTPVAADSDPVGGWKDKSGNANHFLSGIAGNRPAYKTGVKNGKSALLFDGTSDQLTDSISSLTAQTIFVVARSASTVNGKYEPLFTRSGNQGPYLKVTDGTGAFVCDLYQGSDNVSASSAVGSWVVFSASVTSGSVATAYKNSASYATGITYAATTYNSVGGNGSEWLNGHIAEVVVYNTELSGADFTKVQNYLNLKWAIY